MPLKYVLINHMVILLGHLLAKECVKYFDTLTKP